MASGALWSPVVSQGFTLAETWLWVSIPQCRPQDTPASALHPAWLEDHGDLYCKDPSLGLAARKCQMLQGPETEKRVIDCR